MSVLTRRQLVTAAAWSIPVIALAVAAPAAAASKDCPPVTCGGTAQDNGTYVVDGSTLTIFYRVRPDVVDINVRYAGGRTVNIHKDASVVPASRIYTVALQGAPEWIQVHGFNSHFGQDCR